MSFRRSSSWLRRRLCRGRESSDHGNMTVKIGEQSSDYFKKIGTKTGNGRLRKWPRKKGQHPGVESHCVTYSSINIRKQPQKLGNQTHWLNSRGINQRAEERAKVEGQECNKSKLIKLCHHFTRHTQKKLFTRNVKKTIVKNWMMYWFMSDRRGATEDEAGRRIDRNITLGVSQ